MHRGLIVFIVAASLLTACTPATLAIIETDTPTSTPIPTSTATVTFTPEPTPTATPEPITGRLFFDMNGSGLKDQASFNYDPERLSDERQPLQYDLAAAISTYVEEHPELQSGDLITLEEPPLTGYKVCVGDRCAVTDTEGKFSIADPGTSSTLRLKITDPNVGKPALEMRFINIWKKAVIIQAYTKAIDAQSMGLQTTIPSCGLDIIAQVCKQDDDTLLIRDQHLNDTTVQPIDNDIPATVGKYYDLGLMQGFLTAPFPLGFPAYILGYYDIDGRYPWDRNNSVLNYLGSNQNWTRSNPYASTISDNINPATLLYPGVSGTQDGHDGLDIRLDILTPVIAPVEGLVIDIINNNDGENLLKIEHQIGSVKYITVYGHLYKEMNVTVGQTVYRNQLIAFSSNTGRYNNQIFVLHFSLPKIGVVTIDEYTGDILIDPFRNISGMESAIGSDKSYFTIDNFIYRPLLGEAGN